MFDVMKTFVVYYYLLRLFFVLSFFESFNIERD